MSQIGAGRVAGDGKPVPEEPSPPVNGPRAADRLSTVAIALPLAAVAVVGGILAYVQKFPCRFGQAWHFPDRQFAEVCYTDIYPLFFQEKLNEGKIPYFGNPEVEYPVGIGGVMQFVASLARPFADQAVAFYDLTVVLMAASLVAGVLALSFLAGPERRWDGLLYALAPGLILTAYINWDLLVSALALGAFVAWKRTSFIWTGVLLGLAIASKFYPLVFVGALFLLAVRTNRWRGFLITLASSAATWLVVNLPVMIFAFDGFAKFYRFSSERPADWGSIWYFFGKKEWPILGDPDNVDTLGMGLFLVLFAVILVLALTAPNRPRLGQLCFLVLAAFMLTNKVWSPQYVLWLLPFAILARPVARDLVAAGWIALVLWQIAEIWYFYGIWWYLLELQGNGHPLGIPDDAYFTAVWGRVLTIMVMAAVVIWDMFKRRAEAVLDPAGGDFNAAPDWLSLPGTRRRDLIPNST